MNSIESRKSYPNMKRNYQYCDSCGTLLPAPGFFCVRCDPPEPPEPDPEKGLNVSQAYLRIALLTLVFIVIAVVKLEINPLNLFLDSGTDEVSLQVAEDEDLVKGGYRILANHGVNAGQEVPHFHIHIFGKESLGPMISKI